MPFFSVALEVDHVKRFSLKDFERELTTIQKQAFPKAMNRTVNELGSKAKTATKKALVKKLGVKAKRLSGRDGRSGRRYLTFERSTLRSQNYEYTFTGRGGPMPLAWFSGRGLKHRSRKGKMGYSARAFGQRKKYKFFEVRLASGHVGAFVRAKGSTYGRSARGTRGTFPIKQKFGPSVPVGFMQAESEQAWDRMTSRGELEKKLAKNLTFYVGKIRAR